MKLSPKAKEICTQINENTKLGDLRKMAKEIKKDHQLAVELWSTENFATRQLAILIMDKKHLTQDYIDQLDADIQIHNAKEQNLLADWLLANQLAKDKKTVGLIASWENNPSSLLRRIYWYHQARLRWTGNTNHTNTEKLLISIEAKLANEDPGVQWAMNFTAGQIGIWDEKYRKRCIGIGKKIGLYKGLPVPKNCTPDYLPEFISIEVAKKK